MHRRMVSDTDKEERAQLLRGLCRKVERRSMAVGRIDRILHARVPILKLVERESGEGP